MQGRFYNMTKKQLIQLFEDRKVRTVWDDELQKWFFSIVDVCHVLTDSKDYQTARKYWNKLKERLKKEGNESVTNCHQLKLEAADGKNTRPMWLILNSFSVLSSPSPRPRLSFRLSTTSRQVGGITRGY